MKSVVALGEFLIDFTSEPAPDGGARSYTAHPGGAPVNVLVQLAKLGVPVSFIGKVGKDDFGAMLRDTLVAQRISADHLLMTEEANTTLAFVTNREDGDRSFQFNRKPGADQLLRPEEIRTDAVKNAGIFHFGSVSLSHSPAREATIQAVELAQAAGVTVSFDPNIRAGLWDGGEREAAALIRTMLPHADVVKISEEELALLADTEDGLLEESAIQLASANGILVLFVTLGKEGCHYRTRRGFGTVAGFPVDVVDTTGAGDAFLGAALFGLLRSEAALGEQNDEQMREIVRYANAAGALTTTRQGAIPAIPDADALEQFLSNRNS
jgi:fructokinase